ncbi:MAG: molybdenum cofactor biosynthesis protein MoaE [Chloroflexota bacterium]|nr:molybdenum cofactor biosynthesis protein MoaE [Chloroflexota bacterium]
MIELRRDDFSVDEIIKRMKSPRIGAIVTYLGTVREFPEGNGLEFEPDKNSVQKLEDLEQRALDRFDIEDILIIHRVGLLFVSENILLIAVSASHREPAFNACKYIINDIKDFHELWTREV